MKFQVISLLFLVLAVMSLSTPEKQFELLCSAGEYRGLSTRKITNEERLSGSWWTGDLLILEFIAYGFRLRFSSREVWAGGEMQLYRILQAQPQVMGINEYLRSIDRLSFISAWPEPKQKEVV